VSARGFFYFFKFFKFLVFFIILKKIKIATCQSDIVLRGRDSVMWQ